MNWSTWLAGQLALVPLPGLQVKPQERVHFVIFCFAILLVTSFLHSLNSSSKATWAT